MYISQYIGISHFSIAPQKTHIALAQPCSQCTACKRTDWCMRRGTDQSVCQVTQSVLQGVTSYRWPQLRTWRRNQFMKKSLRTEESESDLTPFPTVKGWEEKKYNTVMEKKEIAVIVIMIMALYILIVVVMAFEGFFFFPVFGFPPLIINSQMHCWTRSYFI